MQPIMRSGLRLVGLASIALYSGDRNVITGAAVMMVWAAVIDLLDLRKTTP